MLDERSNKDGRLEQGCDAAAPRQRLRYQPTKNPRARTVFFPGIEKHALFSQGYISRRSSHFTGLAVDIAIDGLDFGARFDFFDPRSSTNSQFVTGAAAANPRTLEKLLRHRRYSNYKR
jgi:zinc D-Ala-D-Ala dipeptidase